MEWHSVKDKLPEIGQTVLGCFQTVDHPHAGNRRIKSTRYYKMCNCDLKVFEDESMYSKVTHWAKAEFPNE